MLLSICIPSYNKFKHLQGIVNSILRAKSNNFEVVVVDNGSSSDIYEEIQVSDKRVRIIKQEIVVKGPTNVRLALEYASGEYAMLCLDKDFVLGEKLDFFIDKLKNLNNVSCGFCEHNSVKEDTNFCLSDDIISNIYRCGHPSGYFFKREYIIGESGELDIMNEKSKYFNFPFLVDLLYAKCLCKGNQAVYTGSLINTETLNDAATNISNSYREKDNNIYFMPDNRINQFWVFMSRTEELGISNDLYKNIIEKQVYRTMADMSIAYKSIMANESLCYHYGIETEHIRKKDELAHIEKFNKSIRQGMFRDISPREMKRIVNKCKIKIIIKIIMKG